MQPLRSHDNVHDAIQLEVRKSTAASVRLLTGRMSGTLTDEAVHEIRTRIKKLRTLLRLVRSSLGEIRYERAKACLQRASHPLAGVRDAKVMLSTCRRMLRRWDRVDRERLYGNLQSRLERARLKASPKRRTLATKLVTVQRLLADWPESPAGWKSLSGGLRREYAAGRNAFEAARSAPTDANFHELRKRAKDLLYTCAFLRKASQHATSLVADLDRFTDLLGTDHDMAILHRAATTGRLVRREPLRGHLSKLAVREQMALRKRAWKIGARIYDDAPAVFAKQIHRDWKKWRR